MHGGVQAAPRNRSSAVAMLLGIDIVVSVMALLLFFAVGGPFGAINDWAIGIAGALTATLVVNTRSPARTGAGFVSALAVLGSVIVVVGAGLVVSRTTGFLLAGLIESFGFALVGIWLVMVCLSEGHRSPNRLQKLGIAAGGLMVIGVIVLPAILAGVDDSQTAPAYVWIGFIGWLGIFVLYPAWAIWFSRAQATEA